ncbi:MAG: lipopolysaccharide kinase InaA family protein [Candidatus Hodarchaeales archaeon]
MIWFSSGSQSIIYKWLYNDECYIVKVFTAGSATNEIFRRIKIIRQRIRKIKDIPVPFPIIERTLPLAQGYIYAEELEEDFEGVVSFFPFLVFNYIEGVTLQDYLRNEDDHCSMRRCRVLEGFIDLLCVIEKAGLVHCDLYPENFLVDNESKMYLIDLESAGIQFIEDGISKKSWLFRPLVRGRRGYFCYPPEMIKDELLFFDRWQYMYLVFRILFKNWHPLHFLKRIDFPALEALYKATKHKDNQWPPEFKKKKRIEPFLNSEPNAEQFRIMINQFLGDKYPDFAHLLIQTYITGLKEGKKRPTMCKDIKPVIKEIVDFVRS